MDLDELRSVQSKERSKDSLQHLRDSFYEDVAAYLGERKRQRDERAASVDQPFSDDRVRKLSNEIETAEEVVESLYERRVGKVVKLSSFAAAGAPTDTEGMTVQEAELFEDLVVRIEQNKSRVLDVLENGADVDLAGDAADADERATAPEATASSASEVAASTAPEAEPAAPPATGGEASAADAPDTAPPEQGSDSEPPAGPGTTSDGSAGGTDATADTADADGGHGVLADAMGGDGSTATDTATGSTTDAQPASTADAGPPAASESESHGSPSDPDGPPEEFVPGSEPDRAGGTDTESAAGEETEASGGDTDRQTVRITRDVGQILGVDEREYELANDDVVSLPTANADPLVERDAAEPIE
ncbi:hypothetical protein [Halobaculum rarum]|uniref:hypothetical protein n=1 Tax=Halobaculum rarum TaxID=3075122 RepID=UPI0032AF3184